MNDLVAILGGIIIATPIAIILSLLLFPHEDHPTPAEEIVDE